MKLFLLLFLITFNSSAFAYLGPGMGGGAIVAALGFLLAVVILFLSLLAKPTIYIVKAIKKLLKKGK